METDNETRPQEAENLKQQQLKEQKEGKGEWKEGLASDSESAVSFPSFEILLRKLHCALSRRGAFGRRGGNTLHASSAVFLFFALSI